MLPCSLISLAREHEVLQRTTRFAEVFAVLWTSLVSYSFVAAKTDCWKTVTLSVVLHGWLRNYLSWYFVKYLLHWKILEIKFVDFKGICNFFCQVPVLRRVNDFWETFRVCASGEVWVALDWYELIICSICNLRFTQQSIWMLPSAR